MNTIVYRNIEIHLLSMEQVLEVWEIPDAVSYKGSAQSIEFSAHEEAANTPVCFNNEIKVDSNVLPLVQYLS